MKGLDDITAEIARNLELATYPRIFVKRPPWWRPFARRRFDRAFAGLRAIGPGRVMIVRASPPSERN